LRGPNSNVTIANGAAILGFSGGLYTCGIEPQNSEWIQAFNANGTFVDKVVFSGNQRKADHVYVVDKYDGCYYFCVLYASFEYAGLYWLYDRRHHQNVGGGFLLVVSHAVSRPSDDGISMETVTSTSDRVAVASSGAKQTIRVYYAGLMEPYQCRNESSHDVMTCRCDKNSRERSVIECEASAAVPWNEVTATACPIRFYPNPHYPNAANDSVCFNSTELATAAKQFGPAYHGQAHIHSVSLRLLAVCLVLSFIVVFVFVYRAYTSKMGRWRNVSSVDV
jgi:hypothetical protein